MRYRCIYTTGSTNVMTGKSQPPDNCIAKGCKGEFERIKLLPDCFTTKSGLNLGEFRRRRQELREGKAKRKPRLTMIDDDASIARAIRRVFKKDCDMPGDAHATVSKDDAIALIREQSPDIIVCDKNFGAKGDHLEVLSFAKKSGARVILFSASVEQGDYSVSGMAFDAIVAKPDWEGLKRAVSRLAGSARDDAVPRLVDASEGKATMTIMDPAALARGGAAPDSHRVMERANTLPSISVVLGKRPESAPPVITELATAETSPSEAAGARAQQQKKKKLLIIEDELDLVDALAPMMEALCDVPDNNPNSLSLEDAKRLVEEHDPDIIISDMKFDINNPDAYHELLDFAKGRNPDVKVILWSCTVQPDEHGSGTHAYDGMFGKADYAGLILAVKKFSG